MKNRFSGKLKRFLYRIVCGFFLGVSVFAPGFSGSVIAIIMGIYQDIVRIVSNPFKKLKANIIFCIPLGIGVVISAVLFILSFQYLFEHYAKATYLLFVGLIAGNLPVIFTQAKKCGFKKHYLIGGFAAFGMALALALVSARSLSSASVTNVTSSLPILASAGFIGGACALVPGMSISMVLILFGVYDELIFMASTLMHLDFKYLILFGVFGLGFLVGLVLSSRLIKFVFDRYPGFANVVVFGFMCGSLLGILTETLRLNDATFHWWLGGIMLIIGLGVSMLFVVLGKKLGTEPETETA
jgi:putative membrane protein